MSDTPAKQNLLARVAGHWQMPLLIFSVVLLVTGIWRLRPEPKPPTFEELIGEAIALADAGFYTEASDHIEKLLAAPERLSEERMRLHELMAHVIYAHESGNLVHGEGNAKRILIHSDLAVTEGATHDATMHQIRAAAWEWLRRPAEALAEYKDALAKNPEEPWRLRRRILEIRRSIGGMSAARLHEELDAFIAAPDVGDELRYWAAEQKVDLLGREERTDDAERFLTEHADQFIGTSYQDPFDYLRGLTWYHAGRLEDAERLLRTLRDRVSPADPVYARAGWLLGRILQRQEAPEPALAFYDDVIATAPPGPYRAAALLGRAETLATLQRFDASVDAYEALIRLTTDNPYDMLVDLREIRDSTTERYHELLARGHRAEALAYLKLAARLVPPADVEKQAIYAQWQADLAFSLGQQAKTEASRGDEEAPERARDYLREAGEQFLRVAKYTSLDAERSSEATWRAADAFDEAGERERVAEVLEKFVLERPTSTRIPAALRRLGQTYQALGRLDEAIARYQRNLIEFPGTPSAADSLVPLADCFIAKGELDKAEQTLLRIVSHRPGEPLRSITPEAREYRDALFRLGELYSRSGDYEQAIAALEQALERYADDERADRARFLLAEAYRRSAARIRHDLRDGKNVAYLDHLKATHQKRLKRARVLYDEVISRHRSARSSSEDDLDRLYLKLSHFYRADVVYDLSRVADPADLTPYARALELYDRAAYIYQGDPMAMTAYMQMITCHLRMGSIDKARLALRRARWALKGISDEAFLRYAPEEDREYWSNYLDWLEQTPTFSVEESNEPVEADSVAGASEPAADGQG